LHNFELLFACFKFKFTFMCMFCAGQAGAIVLPRLRCAMLEAGRAMPDVATLEAVLQNCNLFPD
jgi:hypothetical protein